jgi:hypothetical protein
MQVAHRPGLFVARAGARPLVGEATLRRAAVWCAVLGLVVFHAGWVIVGALQGPGYSAARDAISELSALTARHAAIMLLVNGVTGALLMFFAVAGFGAALPRTSARTVSVAMLAFTPLGFDELSDAFFRLNCQARDGCTEWQEIASWHGAVHAVVGIATIFVLMAAPFVVARTLRRLPEWSDLARPSVVLGVAIDLAVASAAVPHWGGGGQRLAMIAASVWIVLLAMRVRRIGSLQRANTGARNRNVEYGMNGERERRLGVR